MAKPYYTADDLIRSIRRGGQLPVNNNTFKEEDYLQMADEELSLSIVPSIIRQHENYFLQTDSILLVNGKSRYKIPYRAAGNKLKELSMIDTSGNVMEMVKIPLEHISDYNSSYSNSGKTAYYILNDEIVIYPESVVNPTESLLFTYYMRPNKLVKLNKVGAISAIDLVGKSITLTTLPTEFTSSLLYDFVDVESPHRTLGFDIPVVSINATTRMIQFNSTYTFPSRLKVGDHFCIQCETAIPQIPSDLHPMLAVKVRMAALDAVGDSEGLANATTKYSEISSNVNTLVDNRVEGSPKKIVNRNGFLRRSMRNGR